MNSVTAVRPDVVVQASGLVKTFGSTRVLDGVDITLHRGEVLALLGPNGAGKTTTVRILSTLLRPDGGRATVWGHDVVHEAREVRETISLTGQFAAVDEKLTGRENLTIMGRLAHLPRRAVRPRVDELLETFNLVDAADRQVRTYSGGMRRRIDLAAGLLARPSVIFLDEPTTGLDPRSRRAMWVVVRDLVAQGASLFLTTQYLEEADQLADRIVLLDRGRVIAEGDPAELKGRIGQARIEIVARSAEDAARLASTLGVELARSDPAYVSGTESSDASRTLHFPTDGSIRHVRSVLGTVDATGVVPARWDVRTPSLDDVFLALTGHTTGSSTPDTETEPTEVVA